MPKTAPWPAPWRAGCASWWGGGQARPVPARPSGHCATSRSRSKKAKCSGGHRHQWLGEEYAPQDPLPGDGTHEGAGGHQRALLRPLGSGHGLPSRVDRPRQLCVEIEYDILKPRHTIVAQFGFNTEEDVIVFIVNDRDPAWYRCPRPVGRYTSTDWIPGNFLSEGTMVVVTFPSENYTIG